MVVQASHSTADSPSVEQLRMALESKSDSVKIETMKTVLTLMLNGENMSSLLMHVIRFVMPSKNKALKKLLYFYYEAVPKNNTDGTLKQEFILACNAIRNDLQHPNEFIRGNTLRFVCKLREPELLEPLIPTVRACLDHRHAYVRKNAVWATLSVYQLSDHLLPDAPQLLYNLLENESDITCKRNAFVAVATVDSSLANQWLAAVLDSIPAMDDLLQLAVIDSFRKDILTNPQNKQRYLRVLFDLLESSDSVVSYEAASTLFSMTSNPVAVRAAASKLLQLIFKESDNNAKLIMLDRIDEIRSHHAGVLDDLVMDLLRLLTSPDLEVRQRVLELALAVTVSRNVEEVILVLKKELSKTLDQDFDKNTEYRQSLTHAIHQCAIKFPKVASSVIYLLLDFISDFNSAASVEIVTFIKEVMEKFPDLRKEIVSRLLTALLEVKAAKVYRGSLWIIGEYSRDTKDIQEAWKMIRRSVGEVPILASEQRLLEEMSEAADDAEDEVREALSAGSRKILPDGTYATESALTSESAIAAKVEAVKAKSKPPLRSFILEGDFYLATTLSITLVKLVLQFARISKDVPRINSLKAEAMLIMTSIIRVGQSDFAKRPIDEDSVDQIMSCIKALTGQQSQEDLERIFLDDTKRAFTEMLQSEEQERKNRASKDHFSKAVQADDLLDIRQLKRKEDGMMTELHEADLLAGNQAAAEDLTSKLAHIQQLTGFSDPIYAEAVVKVNQFDIMLDVLLVNQTNETLQNLTVEFATLGNIRILDKPSPLNVAPHTFVSVQVMAKVSSTETGVIFGNVTYNYPNLENEFVILNSIHVYILDYIKPGTCTEAAFRSMWTEFEWENKIIINVPKTSMGLREYLSHLMKKTNMACLTPENSLRGDCVLLSANLYAKSVFGEDALMNVSIEKQPHGGIIGHARIRSKGQGIALSIGDLVEKK